MTGQITLKVKFGSDIRKARFQSSDLNSFSVLSNWIGEIYNLNDSSNLLLKYMDGDGELVTLMNDDDLHLALTTESVFYVHVYSNNEDTNAVVSQIFRDFDNLKNTMDNLKLSIEDNAYCITQQRYSRPTSPTKTENIATIQPSVHEEIDHNGVARVVSSQVKEESVEENGHNDIHHMENIPIDQHSSNSPYPQHEQPPHSTQSYPQHQQPPLSSQSPYPQHEQKPLSSQPAYPQHQQPPLSSQSPYLQHQQPPVSNQSAYPQHQQPPVSNQSYPQHQQPPLSSQSPYPQHQQPPLSSQSAYPPQQQPQRPALAHPQMPPPTNFGPPPMGHSGLANPSAQPQMPPPSNFGPPPMGPTGLANPSAHQQMPPPTNFSPSPMGPSGPSAHPQMPPPTNFGPPPMGPTGLANPFARPQMPPQQRPGGFNNY